MSVTTQNEREFATKFLQLLGLSADAKSDQFYSTADYHKLSSLGPTLPKIQVPLPKGESSQDNTTENAAEVSLKSIKPPFKFSTQLTNVPVSHTVYKVKSDLIESLPLLKDAHIKPTHLKLLVKGKVIPDTSSLTSLVNEDKTISFMCMVSQPTTEAGITADPTDDKIDEVTPASVKSDTLVVSEGTWSKIHRVLVEDLGSEELANQALTKLKSGFN
ncbi:unnamed protein product [Debaryomyces tyrocola]|nr:unnamed protein product [Debaryomyces tyrocola]